MPYDPMAPTEEQRARAPFFMWIGAAAQIAALVAYIIHPDPRDLWPFVGFGIGGLLGASLPNFLDDYQKSLVAVGFKWMGLFVAVYTFALWAVSKADFVFAIGYAANGTDEPDRLPMTAIGFANDGFAVGMVAITLFYLGYAYADLRDRFPTGDEA